MDLKDVIISPILTEKSNRLATIGKYTFKVHKKANKPLVKEAIEKLFNVKVDKVNIINVKGKPVSYRKGLKIYRGRRKSWKKAIVTLKEGKFDFFETATTE